MLPIGRADPTLFCTHPDFTQRSSSMAVNPGPSVYQILRFGKLWGVPVYRLLGGPCRDKVRVYPTSKAHKVPPHGISGHAGNPDEIDRMVKAIKATRERKRSITFRSVDQS